MTKEALCQAVSPNNDSEPELTMKEIEDETTTQQSKEEGGKADERENIADGNEDDEGAKEEEENELLKSAYQVAREANIRRNLEQLEALGLLGPATSKALHQDKDEKTQKSKQQRKKRRANEEPILPSRKSRRLQLLEPDGSKLEEKQQSNDSGDESSEERWKRVSMERKIERLKQLHHENQTTYKNPTATYEHTWMRVRTMNDKALSRRVTAIERACGQHCIVKMRMFSEILILAGKQQLAKEAEAALERLQALISC